MQRFLDAAFELIDEKGSTEFTIQEVIERSKQSLRGFYEYFDGKDELVLALFEETVREADDDIRAAVDAESDPLDRLRAFTIRLHEWCDPARRPASAARTTAARSPSSRCTSRSTTPSGCAARWRRISHLLRELLEAAAEAGAIRVADTRRAAAHRPADVMCSWFGNRLVENPKQRLTAEETWEFCLHGLGALTVASGFSARTS